MGLEPECYRFNSRLRVGEGNRIVAHPLPVPLTRSFCFDETEEEENAESSPQDADGTAWVQREEGFGCESFSAACLKTDDQKGSGQAEKGDYRGKTSSTAERTGRNACEEASAEGQSATSARKSNNCGQKDSNTTAATAEPGGHICGKSSCRAASGKAFGKNRSATSTEDFGGGCSTGPATTSAHGQGRSAIADRCCPAADENPCGKGQIPESAEEAGYEAEISGPASLSAWDRGGDLRSNNKSRSTRAGQD